MLSANLGDNANFLQSEDWPGWPTNPSVLSSCPFTKINGKYYCFVPQYLSRNLHKILENLILEHDKPFYDKKYQKARADVLETKALQYINNVLSGAQVYRNLFYKMSSEETGERYECDGLVVYDNNVLIIESKAGRLSESSKRGSIDRMIKDTGALIAKATEQGLRAKNHILGCSEAKFENEDGSTAVVLKRKDYDNIYVINVTIENLGPLATELTVLHEFGVLQGEEYPWSVYINDLRVISEIIETPSEFLLYLKRRIRAHEYPGFRAKDELDCLMFFYQEGLYLEEGFMGNSDRFIPMGYTEPLDRYYDFIGGRVKNGEKPRREYPEKLKWLVEKIEKTGTHGFSDVGSFIIGLDSSAAIEMSNRLEEMVATSISNSATRDVTSIFNDLGLGLTLVTIGFDTERSINNALKLCQLKMYHLKIQKWILVNVDFTQDENGIVSFELIQKKWIYDENMEIELHKYKERKIAKAVKERGKIGRNDACPCDSGLKYKKCCGKKS